MKGTTECRVRHALWLTIVWTFCPQFTTYAQDASEHQSDDAKPLEEIIVSVDRHGKPVDINTIRLEEARLEIITTFEFQQLKEEEEEWRLKLRSASKRNTSRIAWGYDAQAEAARVRILHPDYLPIDRVRPATVVSFRF